MKNKNIPTSMRDINQLQVISCNDEEIVRKLLGFNQVEEDPSLIPTSALKNFSSLPKNSR